MRLAHRITALLLIVAGVGGVAACRPPRHVFVVDVPEPPDVTAARAISAAQQLGFNVVDGAVTQASEVTLLALASESRPLARLEMRFHAAPDGMTQIEMEAENVEPEEIFTQGEQVRFYEEKATIGEVGRTMIGLRGELAQVNDALGSAGSVDLLFQIEYPVWECGGDGRGTSYRRRIYVGGAAGPGVVARKVDGMTEKSSFGRLEGLVSFEVQPRVQPAPGVSMVMGTRLNASFALGAEIGPDDRIHIDIGVAAGGPEWVRGFFRVGWDVQGGSDGTVTSIGLELGSGGIAQVVGSAALILLLAYAGIDHFPRAE